MVENKPNFKVENSCRRIARKMYLKYNGFIPDGYEIHHVDKNPNNNSKENLKAVSKLNHCTFHSKIGQRKGIKLSVKQKEKISGGLKKYYSKNQVWNKGLDTMSEYNKQKLREAQHKKDYVKIGRKISESKKGHLVSSATRLKISNTLKAKSLFNQAFDEVVREDQAKEIVNNLQMKFGEQKNNKEEVSNIPLGMSELNIKLAKQMKEELNVKQARL